MPHLDVYERCGRWVRRNMNVEGRADVLDLFEYFARQYIDAILDRPPRADGRPHKFSIYEIAERVRWAVHIELRPDDFGFKISNDYKPILARILCYRIADRHLDEYIFLRPLIGGEPTPQQIAEIDEFGSYAPHAAAYAAAQAAAQAAAANGHIPREPVPREPVPA